MPAVGAHLVEVNLTESDQQREEYKEREYDVEHRSEPVACGIQRGNIIEKEVAQRSESDGYRQRPFFKKPKHLFLCYVFQLIKRVLNVLREVGLAVIVDPNGDATLHRRMVLSEVYRLFNARYDVSHYSLFHSIFCFICCNSLLFAC